MKYENINMNYKTITNRTKGLREHYHNGYEIIFITDGGSNFTIGSNTNTYEKYDLLFLNDLEKHRMDLKTTPYSRYMIIINSNYFDSFIKEHVLLSIFKNMSSKDKNGFNILEDHLDFVNKSFNDLRNVFSKKDDFWELEFMSILSGLMVFLYRNYTYYFPLNHMNKTQQRIVDIQRHIDENFRSDLSLDSIASDFFISKYYLSHSFKEVTGFTVMQYIFLKRIAYSKDLLYFTDKNIIDIAMDSGFNSQSSYINTFKQNEGVTPLQFRKLSNEKQSEQQSDCN